MTEHRTFRYENRRQRPLERGHFIGRLASHLGLSLALIGVSLLIGMAGYVWFEGLSWTDAFLNAAMLLGGMGPVELPQTEAGKLFAGFYALFAGLVLIASAGILLTPVVHRIMHRFHWEERDKE